MCLYAEDLQFIPDGALVIGEWGPVVSNQLFPTVSSVSKCVFIQIQIYILMISFYTKTT